MDLVDSESDWFVDALETSKLKVRLGMIDQAPQVVV
jgi:hypothetical protein